MSQRNLMPIWIALLAVFVSLALIMVMARDSSTMTRHAAQPRQPGRTTLGVHTLVGQEERSAEAVARTPPLATEPEGSTLLAFVAGHASNHLGPVDNLGNRWAAFGEPVVYAGYERRFDVRAYLVLDARGANDHQVWVDKPGNPQGELTLPVVEIRDAGRLIDAAHRYASPGEQLTSASVTIDGPAVLVAFWWGDGRGLEHSAVPDNGFEIIEQFTRLPPNSAVQCVVAVRTVQHAGTYRVNWTTAPAQGAPLWLFAFGARSP
jgi:hypothetical protein